jgi:transporter family protein
MKLWWVYALLGAVFAGVMPIFVKRGLMLPDGRSIDSNLATAVRIVMLIVPTWLLVAYQGTLPQMPRFTATNWLFLGLSAAATGLSWLFNFKALELAAASRVMPIDKSSLAITLVLAALFLGESMNWRTVTAVVLITMGTILAAYKPATAVTPPQASTQAPNMDGGR